MFYHSSVGRVVDRVARVKFLRWWTQRAHSRLRTVLWMCKIDTYAHAHATHTHAHKQTKNKQTNKQTHMHARARARTYTHVQTHQYVQAHQHEHELEHARTPVCARKYTISTQVCGGVAAGRLALRAVALWLPLRTCHWKWRTRRRVPPPCATSNWVGTSPSDPPSPLLSRPTFCFSAIHADRPKSRRTCIAYGTRNVRTSCRIGPTLLPNFCRPRSRLVRPLPTLLRFSSTWVWMEGGSLLPTRLKFANRVLNISAFEGGTPARQPVAFRPFSSADHTTYNFRYRRV